MRIQTNNTMNKTLLILLATVFAVTACEKHTYVDGTYKAMYNAPSHDYTGFIEFTLTEDLISGLDFDYMNDTIDLRKSEDVPYKERMIAMGGTTSPDIFIPLLESALANATIVPEFNSVDAVSGATDSSENANFLMQTALDLAITGEINLVEVGYPAK